MLEQIIKYQDRLLKSFNIKYKRYLYSKIDFENKMIGVFGARGVGKTGLATIFGTKNLKESNQ